MERRNKIHQVRFDPEEDNTFKKRAKELGYENMSAYIRQSALYPINLASKVNQNLEQKVNVMDQKLDEILSRLLGKPFSPKPIKKYKPNPAALKMAM